MGEREILRQKIKDKSKKLKNSAMKSRLGGNKKVKKILSLEG